jgi:hypothetical protein
MPEVISRLWQSQPPLSTSTRCEARRQDQPGHLTRGAGSDHSRHGSLVRDTEPVGPKY